SRPECEHKASPLDRHDVVDGADVEQKGVCNTQKSIALQNRLQALERVAAEVLTARCAVKDHVVALGLDIFESGRIEDVQPMLPLTDQQRLGNAGIHK